MAGVDILDPRALRAELQQDRRHSVYLLAGADTFRAERTARWLREHSADAAGLGLDAETLYADEVAPARIAAAASSFPMFGGTRFLWVRRAESLPTGPALDPLLRYLASPAPTTVLVLTSSRLDRRLKLTGACAAAGRVVEFAPLSGAALRRQIQRQAKEHGVALSVEAAETLVALVGEDLGELDAELAKLALQDDAAGAINADTVAALVARSRDIDAFQLADQLDAGNPVPALATWLRLRAGGGDVFGTAAIVAWRLRQLVQLRSALEAGATPEEAARSLGLPPWQARRLNPLASATSLAQLQRDLAAWRLADRRAKSTSLGDGLAYDLAFLTWAAGAAHSA